MQSIDGKVNVQLGTSYGAVQENAGSNDTVPSSVWRGEGVRCTELLL